MKNDTPNARLRAQVESTLKNLAKLQTMLGKIAKPDVKPIRLVVIGGGL